MQQTDDLKMSYNFTKIIGIGLIGSLFVYAVMVELIRAGHVVLSGIAKPPYIEALRYIFYGISLAIFLIIKILKNIYSKKQTNNLKELAEKLRVYTILIYSFCEAPAVLGLILCILGGFYKDFYILAVYSLFLYIIYFPRYGNWEELASQFKQVNQ